MDRFGQVAVPRRATPGHRGSCAVVRSAARQREAGPQGHRGLRRATPRRSFDSRRLHFVSRSTTPCLCSKAVARFSSLTTARSKRCHALLGSLRAVAVRDDVTPITRSEALAVTQGPLIRELLAIHCRGLAGEHVTGAIAAWHDDMIAEWRGGGSGLSAKNGIGS